MVNYTVNYLSKRYRKTLLWGCSVGKVNLTKEKVEALRNFSGVVARESYTRDLFQEMGLRKVFLFPDPAFILQPESCDIPEFMQVGEVVGINFSNFVGHNVSANSMIGKNLRNLIDYILKNTSMKIVFIPHVLWLGQDDRVICGQLCDEFKETKRVFLLDSEKYNYCQLRFIISKCEAFIAARTHAAISAYATCVPTLALSYSVKSVGIAKDLGLPEGSVVDAIRVSSATELADKFSEFLVKLEEQRMILQRVMPEYVFRLQDMKSVIFEV